MILCTAQISPCWKDPDATLLKIKNLIAQAVECDASFIAFPEQVVTGWDPADADFGVQCEDGHIIRALRRYAKDYSIGILGSYREYHHPKPRNTAVAIGPDGQILARYSKIHLFSPGGEDVSYFPGDEIGIFTLDGCLCGIALCYDLRFSDLFRLYRGKNIQLMLVPSAWPAIRMRYFELFVTARAAEYQMFVAGINTFGKTPVDIYDGGSLIAGPDGRILTRGCEGEELLFTAIDPEVVEVMRKEFPVYQDRREMVY
jgi:predicted amidohydrolase